MRTTWSSTSSDARPGRLYIGPSDLALSLGLAPTLRIEHPPVLDAIAHVRAAADDRGVPVGLHCLTAADAARFAGEGFAMVTAGSDLLHLRAALAGALAVAVAAGARPE